MEKRVEAITSRNEDFAKWYTDIVRKADLADYSSVKGCMIIRPYGYAIWELIKSALDSRFKETGHENLYMPMFIPEELLQKEKDHVLGFAPEVAWITHGGNEKLTERLCVRPTSEVLFCEHYKNIIQSWRDLPKLYNQWCSVVRWEKTTRPFLRTTEFLWQEGHTAHASYAEANEETLRMLNIYADTLENVLAIPVIKGRKTDREKFAGAESTYTVEAMMQDGKALQSATSHNFSNSFAKAFDITFTNKENELSHVYQTSWGASTRLIGGIIMVHGDDNGLCLPPQVAPIQTIIIPIAQHKAGVLEKAEVLRKQISLTARTSIDISDKQPGWKFSEYEMKGVPLRVEIGPKDIEANQAVLVRRDTGEKTVAPLNGIEKNVSELLEDIQKNLFLTAKKAMDKRIYEAVDFDTFTQIINEKPGFLRAMWCGRENCEITVKEKFAATSRLIDLNGEKISENCVVCGRAAEKLVYWGKSY